MKRLASSLLILLSCLNATADDTEIYTGTTSSVGDPNVIFLFDTSGSMGTRDTIGQDGSLTTRIQASKEAASTIISRLNNINLSIMEFDDTKSSYSNYVARPNNINSTTNRDFGGYITTPMKSINDVDYRNRVIAEINNLPAQSYTPLLESYDEAARYMRGEEVFYGKRYGTDGGTEGTCTTTTVPHTVESGYQTYWGCESYKRNGQCRYWGWITEWVDGYTYNEDVTTCEGASDYGYYYVSDEEAIDKNTGKYISPITDSCQANHIIVFTDGESNNDNESDSRVHTLLGELDSSDWLGNTGMSSNCNTNSWDSCLEEMAYYLHNADNRKDSELDVDDDPSNESIQKIITHTVGGFLSDTSNAQLRLNRMANYGGGIAATANNYKSLVEALQQVFREISSSAGTFSAPAVAVNALNRLENSDELYYTVFAPSTSIGWSGNLKRYRLGSDGKIYDAEDALAVDPTTGFFANNAVSFWTPASQAPDGDSVDKGGASSRLTINRNIYTHLGTKGQAIDDPLINRSSNGTISLADNITQSLFGTSMETSDFLTMMKWASGLDVNAGDDSTARQEIEDPLHSKPVIIHYGVMDDGKTLDSTLYFGTNSGYLHAIDSNKDDPKERFSYIPKELLPNIYEYYQTPNVLGKVYGLDGPISKYIIDNENSDSTNDTAYIIDDNDKAYLYIGMRRGGNNYYALDVSDRDKPVYMWQINGGSGDFPELGQSWSEMTPIDIDPAVLGLNSGQDKKKVLVFGGGYDSSEDATNEADSTRIVHNTGNAIFIVDALTGELLWKASPNADADLRLTGMTSSIASNIVPVDNNDDGDIDILYAADVGGRIWRIDLMATGKQYGTVIADLNEGNTIGNARFFTSPSVSYAVDKNGTGRYVIAIGSGYRAHPLNTESTDNFYVIYDYMVSENETFLEQSLKNYSTLSKSDLADYDDYNNESLSRKNNGLFFTMPDNAEKVLSDAITADYTIYFTSFRPEDTTAISCSGNAGNARLYSIALDFLNPGRDTTTVVNNVVVTSTDLSQSGIPASPVLTHPPSKTSGSSSSYDEDETEQSDDPCDSSRILLIGSESVSLDSCVVLNKNYWREL